MKRFLILLSFLLLLTSCFHDGKSPVFSYDTREAFKTAVDDAFNNAENKNGISVAVIKDGYKVWTYARGDASEGVAMTVDTPGYAYSITKTFVSALVLTQIEAGLYSLNDTVDELLGDDADFRSLSSSQKALININATVEQLLKHTSGMPDYASNVAALIGMCDTEKSWKPADILEKIVNQPYGTPGTFQYSNTNYILLGMIAEHVSGKELNKLLNAAFFSKIGIQTVLSPQDSIPENISHPYDDAALFGFPADSFLDMTDVMYSVFPDYNYYIGTGRSTWAAGGIIAIAEDLALWGYELYDEDGNAVTSSVRRILKASAPGDGDYGYGVSHDEFTYDDGTAGEKYGHGGSAPGYKTLLRYEEAEHISVAIMTNTNNIADTTSTSTDTDLGLVDREALADALLNAYKNNH